jgi:hypothetical protein
VTAHPSTKPGDPVRQLLFVTTPALWPAWPFLPVVRRAGGAEELGVMFDARTVCGRTGFGSTVFRTNLFALPPTVDALLALPREAFDSGEELLAAGWAVD